MHTKYEPAVLSTDTGRQKVSILEPAPEGAVAVKSVRAEVGPKWRRRCARPAAQLGSFLDQPHGYACTRGLDRRDEARDASPDNSYLARHPNEASPPGRTDRHAEGDPGTLITVAASACYRGRRDRSVSIQPSLPRRKDGRYPFSGHNNFGRSWGIHAMTTGSLSTTLSILRRPVGGRRRNGSGKRVAFAGRRG